MLSSDVMDLAAVLLNDSAKSQYTYAKQLPLLSKANDELETALILNGVSPVKKQSAVVTMAIGTSLFSIPADMADPLLMGERAGGTTGEFSEMTQAAVPPEIPASSLFGYWTYINLTIVCGPANGAGALTSRDVKLTYNRLLTSITTSASVVEITKSKQFLAERTAALCARFLGENPSRADSLDLLAFGPEPDRKGGSLGDTVMEFVRSNQGTPVRRRGYRRNLR